MSTEESKPLFVRCKIGGKPAQAYRELKERGIVLSIREAVVHGFLALHDREMMRDLRAAQVQTRSRVAHPPQ